MALLEPGYWPSTYWPSRYWPTNPQYWPEYAAAAAPTAPAAEARPVISRRRRKRRPQGLSLDEAAAAFFAIYDA